MHRSATEIASAPRSTAYKYYVCVYPDAHVPGEDLGHTMVCCVLFFAPVAWAPTARHSSFGPATAYLPSVGPTTAQLPSFAARRRRCGTWTSPALLGRSGPVRGCAEEPPRRWPTALAIGPMVVAQVVGAQFFVPVYLPLLMLSGAIEGRVDGWPAAAALGASTALYALFVTLVDATSGATLPVLVGVNAAAASLLLLLDPPRPPQASGTSGELGGSDKLFALVLTLGLSLFLTTTTSQVASLRPD